MRSISSCMALKLRPAEKNHLSTCSLEICTKGMPVSAGPGRLTNFSSRVGAVVRGVVDIQNRDGAVRASVQRLAEQLRVLGINPAFEDTVADSNSCGSC